VVSKTAIEPEEDAVDRFVDRHAPLVTHVLSGFDRLVIRGVLQPLVQERGMFTFLCRAGRRLLDFKDFALETSTRVKEAALAVAKRRQRPVQYLESPKISKENLARKLLAEHPVQRGLVCAFTAVEPCMSFEYHRSPDPAARGLKLRPRKCLHVYQYHLHPTFGFLNARIQTWFPFNVQICLNGREWLARQLDRRSAAYKRADNCFTWLANPQLAQRLLDEQLQTDWPGALTDIARDLNPLHEVIFEPWPMDYYWSAYQTEWATDVVFRNPAALAALYPDLVRHAITHFQSPDVMRFLGRKAHACFTGEITTSFKDRAEGVRVKHWVRGNSIKMYDKAGSVLRVETTIAKTDDFKVLRPPHDDPAGRLEWRPLRKGVADLHRRAQLSQRSNERYLDALAEIEDTTPCSRLFDAVARPVVDAGRRFRALRIGDPDDLALLELVSRGEFKTAGLRNRDLRRLLFPTVPAADERERRRLSAKLSRKLRLLRAHGLIKRIHRTHRYQLTQRGQLLTTALRATRDANIKSLLREAA
jgi:hypothetical protein